MPTAGTLPRANSADDRRLLRRYGCSSLGCERRSEQLSRRSSSGRSGTMLDGLDHQPVPMQMVVERLAPRAFRPEEPALRPRPTFRRAAIERHRSAFRNTLTDSITAHPSKFDLLYSRSTEGLDSRFECDIRIRERAVRRRTDRGHVARRSLRLLENALDDPIGRSAAGCRCVDPDECAAALSRSGFARAPIPRDERRG